MDKKKQTVAAKEEKEVNTEKKAERKIETLDLNKAQVESFWFPGKGAKKEVVDEYINEAAVVLMPIIIGIIKSFIQTMPIQHVRYLIGLFLMLADGYQKEVKRKLISSLLEDQEILRYYKDLLILPYEPIGEDAMKHVDDFKSIVHGPFMSLIAAIKAPMPEELEEKEEEKTKKKDTFPKVSFINEDTVIGKVRSFFSRIEDDSELKEKAKEKEKEEQCGGGIRKMENETLEEFRERVRSIK